MLLKLGKVLHGMQKRKEEERGFTLIELLVVVIIIGVLAAIAIPAYLAQTDRARDAVVDGDARQAGTAIQTCLMENANTACASDDNLQPFGYRPSDNVGTAYTTTDGGVQITVTYTGQANTATYNSVTGNVS